MSKFITILITYYNEKELIKRCLQSIESQLLKPAEVIIYDDASEFRVTDYVNVKDYSFPIRLIRGEENRGPGYGRNFILNLATTAYVRFFDADDEILEDTLALIEERIEETNADCILNEVTTYDESGNEICYKVIGLTNDIKDIFEFSLTHALLPTSATFKREIVLSIGGFKEREILPQSEDTDLSRRFFLKTSSYSFIDKSLAKQNIRKNSHSHATGLQQVWPSGLKSLLSLKSEISNEHLPAYADALLQNALSLYERKNYEVAKIGFDEYLKTGKGNFENYNSIKRVLAKTIGPLNTEHLSRYYRNILPEKLRKILNT